MASLVIDNVIEVILQLNSVPGVAAMLNAGGVKLDIMTILSLVEQPLAVLVTVTVNVPAAETVAVFVPDTAVAPALQL
jgi:hypothetical protein